LSYEEVNLIQEEAEQSQEEVDLLQEKVELSQGVAELNQEETYFRKKPNLCKSRRHHTFKRERIKMMQNKNEGSLFILKGEGSLKEITIKLIYLINININ
jgi:uracil DNA glycosylase